MEEQRGKRRLANYMFAALAALFFTGLASDDAKEFAYFLTPWIFGAGLALYGLDGKFANDRELLRYSTTAGKAGGDCECAGGEDSCPKCGKDRS